MASLLILIPFICIILLNLPIKEIKYRIGFELLLALTVVQTFGSIIFALNPAIANQDIFIDFFKFNLLIDKITCVLLISIAIAIFSALLVGRTLIKEKERLFTFINLLLLSLAGMNGIVLVTDIFSMYVFIEITAVASYILIAFNRESDGLEASFKYIILSAVATALMLASIALLMMASGDTSFCAIKTALILSSNNALIITAIGLFLCGLFIKGGMMPFHGWLPDAYSAAPAPVSILLAGIVTKTLGIYTLIRIVNNVFGFNGPIQEILLFIGTISIVLAALAALGQKDFKRMLAYSSISQMGYIVIGLGCGTPLGILGAVFHLFNHTIFKSLLFVNSSAVETQTGSRDLDNLSGLGEKMPITSLTSLIGSLSAAGIPPLSGFWSKIIIVIALWKLHFHVYAIIAILASIITLAYFLSLQRRLFWGKIKEELSQVKEAEFDLLLPAIVLALIIIWVGIIFPFLPDALSINM